MSKAKGSKAERDVVSMLWGAGWAAIRSAGSGSMSFPSPDILAGNKERVLAIEVKITKETKKYFSDEEIRQLKNFSEYFGAEPWIAIKFAREQWVFFNPEDLERTETAFAASVNLGLLKGVSFDQLIGRA